MEQKHPYKNQLAVMQKSAPREFEKGEKQKFSFHTLDLKQNLTKECVAKFKLLK